MAYGLPARGQQDWDDELNNSLDAIKGTVDSAEAKANNAVSTANAASDTAVTAAAQAAISAAAAESAAANASRPTDEALTGVILDADSQARAALGATFASIGPAEAERITSGNVTVSEVMGRIPATTPHAAFPSVVVDADGDLVCVYRGGTSHSSTDGSAYLTRSTDKGRTWSTPAVLVDDANDVRDPCIALLSNGDLAVTYKLTPTEAGRSRFIRSSDGGQTWTAPVTIGFTFTGWDFISAPVVELGDGSLVAACYGKNTADARTSVQTARSTDGGATWGDVVTVANGVTLVQDYQEPNLLVESDGTLRIFIRTEFTSPYVIKTATSTDGGLTWSALSVAFEGNGNPHAYRLPDATTVVCVYRDQDTGYAAVRTSHDDGATWTDAHLFGKAENYMTYASMVEVETGQLLCVWGREDADDDSHLHTAYLGATSGTPALGGALPSESLVRVDPRVQIVKRLIPGSLLQPANGSPTMMAFASGQAAWHLDAASTEAVAGWLDFLPKWWRTFDVSVLYAPTTTAGGNIQFDLSYTFFGVAEALSGGTYVSGTSNLAAAGTSVAVRKHTLATGLTNDPAQYPYLRILRAGAAAGDTYGSDVAVMGVLLTQAS